MATPDTLRPQETDLDAIFDTLREPLLVLDADVRILAANRAFYRVFGTKREETLGVRLYDLGNGQWNIPRMRELLGEILPRNAYLDDFKVDHVFQHIGRRVMLVNARKIYRPGNHAETILLSIEDVTERMAAEDALRQKNAEMEQFIYTVSHDLKSPLVTVTGFVGMLESHLLAGREDKIPHTLDRIRRAARRMSMLIDELLRLSRIGRVQDDPVEVDVAAMVLDLGKSLHERLEASGCRLVQQPDLPPVLSDPERLTEVFENLLSNAIKYAGGAGATRIEVGAETSADELRYYVRDDGPGIDPAYHEMIFRLFERLDTRQDGTGVGLAMVAKVMQAQGGRAWVTSQLGEGATFWISFPYAAIVSESKRSTSIAAKQ